MARGEVRYKLTADNKAFRTAFQEAEKQVADLGKAFADKIGPAGSILEKLGPYGVAAAAGIGALAAGAVAAGAALSKALDQADKLSNLSAKTGLSTDALQKLGAVGLTTGTSMETLGAAVSSMQKSLVESPKGFERMGLSAQKLMAMKPEEAFARIAEKINSIENPAERSAAAVAAFGKGGVELLPLLSTNIAEVSARAVELGLVMSEDVVGSLDELGDQLDLTKAAGEAIVTNFGSVIGTSSGVKEAVVALGNVFGALSRAILDNKGPIQEVTSLLAHFALDSINFVANSVSNMASITMEKFRAMVDGVLLVTEAFGKFKAALADMLTGKISPMAFLEGQKASLGGVVNGLDQVKDRMLALNVTWKDYGALVEKADVSKKGGHYFGKEDAEGAAKAIKDLADEIFRFQNVSFAAGAKRTKEFWEEQTKAADGYGKKLLFNLQVQNTFQDKLEDYARDLDRQNEELHRQSVRATQDFGDLGNAIAGLGQVLGSGFLANLGQAMDLFAQISVQAQNAATGMQKATVAIGALSTAFKSGSVLGGAAAGAGAGSMFGPWGAAIGGIVGGLAGLAGKLGIFGNKAIMETNRARDAFFKAEGGFEAFSKKMARVSSEDWAKKIFDAKSVEDFNRLVSEAQDLLGLQGEAQENVNAAMERYGITIQEAGGQWAQARFDEQAGQLLQDYKLLTAAGVDHNVILAKMGPSFNDYVNSAVAAGSSIPEAMRPVIQSLIDSGQLLDANGQAYTSVEQAGISFSQTMSQQFSTLIEKIDRMVSALLGIPSNVNTNVNIHENRSYSSQQEPGAPPEFRQGGVVLPFRRARKGIVEAPRPGGVMVNMAEGGQTELAAPVAGMLREMTKTALAAGGGGGNSKPLILVLDREVIGRTVINLNQSGRVPIKASTVRRQER